MANNHKGEEPVSFVMVPNGGRLPKWSDGTIGWQGREDIHRDYLQQHKFNKLDEYDEQILHDGNKQNLIKTSDTDRLKDEVATLEKLSRGPFMKDRHIDNVRSQIDKKLNDIQSQMKYMKNHNMEDTTLYKQLETLSARLKDARSNLNNM